MKIIDGKSLAAKIREEIKKEIAELGITPGLAVILVGADPSSHLYVGLKERACAEVGIHFEKYLFFATEPEEKIIKKIQELNANPDIHGILVQLPLPSHFDESKIIAALDPQKDADGFHPANIDKLMRNEPTIVPPLISGILKLIESTGVAGQSRSPTPTAVGVGLLFTKLTNKKIAILANSEIFAKPLAKILEDNRVTVAINPVDPAPLTRDADIIITALGRPKFLTGEMIKDGAILIDVGTTRLENGATVGDVDFSAEGGFCSQGALAFGEASGEESVSQKAGWLTPVPGGVGPMTVAMLLKNVLDLAR